MDVERPLNRSSRRGIPKEKEEQCILESIMEKITKYLENRVLTLNWMGHSVGGRMTSGRTFIVPSMCDDLAILARGSFEEDLVEFVLGALNVMDRWCRDKGLSIQEARGGSILQRAK